MCRRASLIRFEQRVKRYAKPGAHYEQHHGESNLNPWLQRLIAAEFAVTNGRLNVFRFYRMRVFGERDKQRFICNKIDATGQSRR